MSVPLSGVISSFRQKIQQVKPSSVDWKKEFSCAQEVTAESVQAHLTHKEKHHGFPKWAVFLAWLLMAITLFSTVAGFAGLGGGFNIKTGTAFQTWITAIAVTSVGGMSPGLALWLMYQQARDDAKANARPDVNLVVPIPVSYSAKLRHSSAHVGGQAVITRESSAVSKSHGNKVTEEILILDLPTCDVKELSLIMEAIKEELVVLAQRDNEGYQSMLNHYHLQSHERSQTIASLIEQGKAIQEYNYLSNGVFASFNEVLQEEIKERTHQLIEKEASLPSPPTSTLTA